MFTNADHFSGASGIMEQPTLYVYAYHGEPRCCRRLVDTLPLMKVVPDSIERVELLFTVKRDPANVDKVASVISRVLDRTWDRMNRSHWLSRAERAHMLNAMRHMRELLRHLKASSDARIFTTYQGEILPHHAPVRDDTETRPLQPIGVVVARDLDAWDRGQAMAAMLYARGLVTGAVKPVTDPERWRDVPHALGYRIGEQFDTGVFRWTLGEDEWTIGMFTLHGLAKGIVQDSEEAYAIEAADPTTMPWRHGWNSLEETGLTVEAIARKFRGDLLAAARVLLKAYPYACPIHRAQCAEANTAYRATAACPWSGSRHGSHG